MKGQTKRSSVVEVVVNVLIGYSIAIIAQMFIFPLFDIIIPLSQHMAIGLFFTVVSLVRSYGIRRLFNYLYIKDLLK